jgi:hypothetical protein
MPKKNTPAQFIGVSIQDFLEGTRKQVATGSYSDGTAMKSNVREALTNLTNSLSKQRLRISSYVFVWSRHFFVVVDF